MKIPRKKVVSTYGYQVGAFIARVASLMIVTPMLSSDRALFGVYSICASLLFFLNYADLGFLSAAKKCAATSNAAGSQTEERRYLSFALLVTMLGSLLLSGACFLASIRLDLFLQVGVADTERLASTLLLVTGLAAPIVASQRVVGVIFEIRIEGYHAQKWAIIGSVCTTLVGYLLLHTNDQNRIMEFFVASQLIALATLCGLSWSAWRRYGYGLWALLLGMKPDGAIFRRILGLSVTGMWATVCWIVFFEIDLLYIGKLCGAQESAIYAIALTLSGLFRSIYGILFLPLATHANRIVGTVAPERFRAFLRSVALDFAPVAILPVTVAATFSAPLVVAWVGHGYDRSGPLVSLLLLPYGLSFLSYSWGIILVAQERNREVRWFAALQACLFWMLVLLGDATNIGWIALVKLLVLGGAAIVAGIRFASFLGESPWRFAGAILKRTGVGALVALALSLAFVSQFDVERSPTGLAQVLIGGLVVLAVAGAAQFAASSELRHRVGLLLERGR